RAGQARGATADRDPPARSRSRSRAARARAARLLLMARRHPAPPAHPWRRFMGFAYEAVLLFGVVWFADYAFSALTQFRGHPGALRTAFQWFTLAVLAVYFTGF